MLCIISQLNCLRGKYTHKRTHILTHSHTIIVRFRYGQAFVLNVRINCCVNDTTPMVYTHLGYGVVAVVAEPAWIRIHHQRMKNASKTKNNNHENAYRKQLCTHSPIFLLTFNYFVVWILYSLFSILLSRQKLYMQCITLYLQCFSIKINSIRLFSRI